MPAAAKRLTSVQPNLARTASWLGAQAGQQRMRQPERGGCGHVEDLELVALGEVGGDHRRDVITSLVGRAVRGEAVVQGHDGQIGHDVAGHAALGEDSL